MTCKLEMTPSHCNLALLREFSIPDYREGSAADFAKCWVSAGTMGKLRGSGLLRFQRSKPANNSLIGGTELPEFYGPPDSILTFASQFADYSAFDPTDETTRNLQNLLLIHPGSVSPRLNSDVEFTPLITLKPDASGTIDLGELTTTLQVAAIDPQTGTASQKPLQSVATGRATITMNPQPAQSGPAQLAPVVAARISSEQINVILIADTDFASEYFQRHAAAMDVQLDNLPFLETVIESLAGAEDYLQLRQRRAQPKTLRQFEQRIQHFRELRAQRDEAATKKLQQQLNDLRDKTKEMETRLSDTQDISSIARRQQRAMQAQQAVVNRERTERRLP